MSDLALYELLTFHVPNLMLVFFSWGHLSKESIQFRSHLWHFVRSVFLRWGVLSPAPSPQDGGPPFAGSPWLLILYTWCDSKVRELIAVKVLYLIVEYRWGRLQGIPLGKLCADASIYSSLQNNFEQVLGNDHQNSFLSIFSLSSGTQKVTRG
jgi:hypothetical protein